MLLVSVSPTLRITKHTSRQVLMTQKLVKLGLAYCSANFSLRILDFFVK